jgi:1,2-phenylacetyl-CoA epoxidase catalytic subunit
MLAQSPVAVEKLASGKFAKNAMRQDALQTIFSGRIDMFYPQNLR